MDCSIIVPAYNAEKTVSACIHSLIYQNAGGISYEIIVVDDGSWDQTGATVRQYPKVRYLRQSNQGPARARNYGAEVARGKILLFTDSDCEASSGWLRQMIKPFEDPQVAAVKGAYLTRQKEWVAKIVQAEYEGKYRKMLKEKTIDFVDSYSAAFRKEIFNRAGGYDTGFPNASVEDQEFSFRVWRLGHKMVFNPEATVYHRHAATLKAYVAKKFKIGYWKVRVLKRHPDKMLGDSHTPQTLKAEMLLSCLGLPLLAVSALLGSEILFCAGLSLLAGFIGLAAIEMRFVFSKNIWMGLSSIPVLLFRSLALGSGLLYGLKKN